MISVQFGIKTTIKNTDVLFKVDKNGICEQPIFCHPGFVVETTFRQSDDPNGEENSKFGILIDGELQFGLYTKTVNGHIGYRKQVLWNFGDGTEIEGYNAKHAYERPGKYRISCILFDIDRKGIENEYHIDVIVKEVIPTMLSFNEELSSKATIKCSKPERIARVQATLSNTVAEEFQICAKRVFYYEPEEHENTYEEIKEKEFPNLQKYYTFLERQSDFYYNSETVYCDDLVPVTKYTPKYENIIGEFIITEDKNIGVNLYQFLKFKNSEKPKPLKILSPSCKIVEREVWQNVEVKPYYNISELNEDCWFFGRRAFTDIFYKSDYITVETKISLFFNIEEQKFDRKLLTSTNYTNIPPLGLHFSVIGNIPNEVRNCLTLNGFIHKAEELPWDEFDKYHIEDYCRHSLYRNRKLPCILIPYIPLTGDEFVIKGNEYYIPKDITMSCDYMPVPHPTAEGDESNILIVHSDINKMQYLKYFILDLKDYVDISIKVYGTGNETNLYINNGFIAGGDDPPYLVLQDLNELVIPREKLVQQNIDALIECYFPHPMFKEADVMKSFFRSILANNGALDNILTRSAHFIDDTVNYKTSYISNLLSLLLSLNEDVKSYEFGDFGGVYELRDFARLLSMNTSDLIGNVYTKQYDLYADDTYKGKNLGNKIRIEDIIEIDKNGSVVAAGIHAYDPADKTQIVIIDDYTNEPRIANFSKYAIETMDQWEGETKSLSIGEDYENFWGWNLLLPDSYSDKSEIIDNHYSFYIFKDISDKKYINNFIREEDIVANTSQSQSFYEKWIDEWGLPYDSIFKIIDTSLALTKVGEYKGEIEDEDSFNISKSKIAFYMEISDMLVINVIDILQKYIAPITENDIVIDVNANYDGKLHIEWGDGDITEEQIDPARITTQMSHLYKPSNAKEKYLITVFLSKDIWEKDEIYGKYKLVAKSQNSDNSIDNKAFIENEKEPQLQDKPLTVYTLSVNHVKN